MPAPAPTARRLLLLAALLLAVITWLDYVTGYELGFFIFYFVPVSIGAWWVSRRAGLALAFASAFCWYLSDRLAHHPYSNALFIYWETIMRLASFATTALTLARIRRERAARLRLQEELSAALAENRALRAGRQEAGGSTQHPGPTATPAPPLA
jgi:hypothetical protein